MKDPLIFSSETPMRKFAAYIDPENKFALEDKLSQINTLEQCKFPFINQDFVLCWQISLKYDFFSFQFQCRMWLLTDS